jgi:hypothetical protein
MHVLLVILRKRNPKLIFFPYLGFAGFIYQDKANMS